MLDQLIVEPVWVTTRAHIEAVRTLLVQPTLWAQIFRRYPIPPGKPYLQYHWAPFSRVPVAPLANGRLTVTASGLEFAATPYRLPRCEIYNLDTKFHFGLAAAAVRFVSPYRMRSPISNRFDLPFTRITTTAPEPLHDFLVCVGSATGDMAAIRQHSARLHLALEALLAYAP